MKCNNRKRVEYCDYRPFRGPRETARQITRRDSIAWPRRNMIQAVERHNSWQRGWTVYTHLGPNNARAFLDTWH